MVVQHNLTAMNSNRLLGLTTASQAKSTEKLSSGYKINRAADDASGLAISEKMRKQIRGLTQASANAEDGISAVQTAEGALTEVHDMLQRMNELAVKASNETNSESDRNYIQSEVDALVTEIDRVATTTKFNEIYLLKGTNNGTDNPGVGKSSYATAKLALDNVTELLAAGMNETDGTYTLEMVDKESDVSNVNGGNKVTGTGVEINGKTYVYSAAATTDTSDTTATGKQIFNSIDDMLATIKKDLSNVYGGEIMGLEVVTDEDDGTQNIVISTFADMNSGLSTKLHVGADSSSDNKIGLNIQAMSARTLGINGIRVDGTNDKNATAAIDTIASALKIVSSQRSELGSVQNRLEHTINNLDNIVENTTSAESAIRDTDMATEMVKYSNYNILAQAGQSMLAQANQSNQGVLSLLG